MGVRMHFPLALQLKIKFTLTPVPLFPCSPVPLFPCSPGAMAISSPTKTKVSVAPSSARFGDSGQRRAEHREHADEHARIAWLEHQGPP